MSPPKEDGPGGGTGATSETTSTNSHHAADAANHSAGYRRSVQYWGRRGRLDCRCTDPCRCDFKAAPSLKRTDAYYEAIAWLEDLGLLPAAFMPECRELWSRGGDERATSSRVVRRWSA
jgi:hypothetical protein